MNRTKKPGQISRPTGLHAVATSHKAVLLTWNTAPDSAGVTGFLIERCEPGSSRNDSFSQIGGAAGTTYADSRGLFSGSTYEYRIRATTLQGVSSYSGTVSVTTQQAPSALKKLALDVQSKLPDDIAALVFTGEACDLSALDLDSRCIVAAIKAGLALSLSRAVSPAAGKGWDFDVDLVLAGYEAGKAALSRANEGNVDAFLYATARGAIQNQATEQYSVSGKRRHHATTVMPTVIHHTPDTLETLLVDQQNIEQMRAEAAQLLDLLDPASGELLAQYAAGHTFAELGAEYGVATATAARNVKRATDKVRALSQISVADSVY